MNIYIYGNSGFKKEIHSTLDHANIKFKLDDNSIIKDINTLEELQDTIKNNPNDIYLIDDEKIIKKNSKIKFLNPKDGIEESFLLDHGIPDVSVDSLSDIPKYIIKKHDELLNEKEDIQNSIIDIVDEAYENDKDSEEDESFELDEELSMLLAKEDDSQDEKIDVDNNKEIDINLDELDDILGDDDLDSENLLDDEELSKIMSFDEDVGLDNIDSDYDSEENLNIENEDGDIEEFSEDFNSEDLLNFDTIEETDEVDEKTEDKLENIESLQGEKMGDEFSELDALSENDILDALGELDTQDIETSLLEEKSVSKQKNSVEINSNSVNELSTLISQLLQNKTLEITIKIKD